MWKASIAGPVKSYRARHARPAFIELAKSHKVNWCCRLNNPPHKIATRSAQPTSIINPVRSVLGQKWKRSLRKIRLRRALDARSGLQAKTEGFDVMIDHMEAKTDMHHYSKVDDLKW